MAKMAWEKKKSKWTRGNCWEQAVVERQLVTLWQIISTGAAMDAISAVLRTPIWRLFRISARDDQRGRKCRSEVIRFRIHRKGYLLLQNFFHIVLSSCL